MQPGEISQSHAQRFVLSASVQKQIDHWLQKFPEMHAQSALLAALHIVQDDQGGSLSPESMEALADYLGLPAIAVYEVASFYVMYDLQPVGRYKLYVCTNIVCQLRGSDDIMAKIQNRLQIQPGETTPDQRFTLKNFECLGACIGAPMMQINKDYYENLTPEKVDEILDHLP